MVTTLEMGVKKGNLHFDSGSSFQTGPTSYSCESKPTTLNMVHCVLVCVLCCTSNFVFGLALSLWKIDKP